MEITDISTGNIIAKGITNHASKGYQFSHFMPFLEPVHSQREGTNIPSPSFVEPVVSDHEIKIHSDSDSDSVPTSK